MGNYRNTINLSSGWQSGDRPYHFTLPEFPEATAPQALQRLLRENPQQAYQQALRIVQRESFSLRRVSNFLLHPYTNLIHSVTQHLPQSALGGMRGPIFSEVKMDPVSEDGMTSARLAFVREVVTQLRRHDQITMAAQLQSELESAQGFEEFLSTVGQGTFIWARNNQERLGFGISLFSHVAGSLGAALARKTGFGFVGQGLASGAFNALFQSGANILAQEFLFNQHKSLRERKAELGQALLDATLCSGVAMMFAHQERNGLGRGLFAWSALKFGADVVTEFVSGKVGLIKYFAGVEREEWGHIGWGLLANAAGEGFGDLGASAIHRINFRNQFEDDILSIASNAISVLPNPIEISRNNFINESLAQFEDPHFDSVLSKEQDLAYKNILLAMQSAEIPFAEGQLQLLGILRQNYLEQCQSANMQVEEISLATYLSLLERSGTEVPQWLKSFVNASAENAALKVSIITNPDRSRMPIHKIKPQDETEHYLGHYFLNFLEQKLFTHPLGLKNSLFEALVGVGHRFKRTVLPHQLFLEAERQYKTPELLAVERDFKLDEVAEMRAMDAWPLQLSRRPRLQFHDEVIHPYMSIVHELMIHWNWLSQFSPTLREEHFQAFESIKIALQQSNCSNLFPEKYLTRVMEMVQLGRDVSGIEGWNSPFEFFLKELGRSSSNNDKALVLNIFWEEYKKRLPSDKNRRKMLISTLHQALVSHIKPSNWPQSFNEIQYSDFNSEAYLKKLGLTPQRVSSKNQGGFKRAKNYLKHYPALVKLYGLEIDESSNSFSHDALCLINERLNEIEVGFLFEKVTDIVAPTKVCEMLSQNPPRLAWVEDQGSYPYHDFSTHTLGHLILFGMLGNLINRKANSIKQHSANHQAKLATFVDNCSAFFNELCLEIAASKESREDKLDTFHHRYREIMQKQIDHADLDMDYPLPNSDLFKAVLKKLQNLGLLPN